MQTYKGKPSHLTPVKNSKFYLFWETNFNLIYIHLPGPNPKIKI